MPERVDDVPVPVAVELVLRGSLDGRAEFRGAGDDRVDILDVDEQVGGEPGQAAGRRCLGRSVAPNTAA